MLKVLNLKTFGAVALSFSLLLGALAVTPAFAKVKEITRPDGAATITIMSGSMGLDNDGDELNETGEPMPGYSQAYNRRIDGSWTFKNGRG